jgi:NTP pyrophosphatase (non-canonical NTP hydrolase)
MYQQLAARTINPANSQIQNLLHALHGMSAEVGEIHGIYQKSYQGHEVDENDLKAELGDLLWFCAEYCTAQGWDMEQICVKNIEKLRVRYPKGFSAERSLHREK